jgi:hypothetical protein
MIQLHILLVTQVKSMRTQQGILNQTLISKKVMLEFERKLEKQNEICSINTLGVLARGRSHLSHWP